jgi:hypothetical protein
MGVLPVFGRPRNLCMPFVDFMIKAAYIKWVRRARGFGPSGSP